MNYKPTDFDGDLVEWSKRVFWIAFRQTFGWTLLGVGVAGLALPILPGWLFIGWGILTLAADIPFFRRLVDRVEDRLPRLKAVIQRMKHRHHHKQDEPSSEADRSTHSP